MPLRRLAELPDLRSWLAAAAFAFSLAVAWGLAILAFRRAAWSGDGHTVAAFSIAPGIQTLAMLVLAILPALPTCREAPAEDADGATIVRGVLAGMAIIAGAVLISAVGFGSYGWGLFVLTPFLVGVTTAYIVNRGQELFWGRTLRLVLWAGASGRSPRSASRSKGSSASCSRRRSVLSRPWQAVPSAERSQGLGATGARR